MYEQNKDDVQFFLIYIKEAHPEDGWQVDKNKKDNIIIMDPKTILQRRQIANTCVKKLKLSMETIVDSMDNKTNEDYSAWPERIYIIGKNGHIVYKGGPGPSQFNPKEAEQAMKKMLKSPS